MDRYQWATMKAWAGLIHIKQNEILEHLKEIGYVFPEVKSLKNPSENQITQEGQLHCMIGRNAKGFFYLWDMDTFSLVIKECLKRRELIQKCPRCRKHLDQEQLYSPDFKQIECEHCGYHGDRYIQYLQYKKIRD